MDSDELPDLSPGKYKPQPPKHEVMLIPDDSTTLELNQGTAASYSNPPHPGLSHHHLVLPLPMQLLTTIQ